ncbi:MAG TPA: hypothetical protein IAC24_03375 [Candidatus Onthousia faecigallinarum]|nr:hypothetical protein [Candidatus Onthousia faecigallinarum]
MWELYLLFGIVLLLCLITNLFVLRLEKKEQPRKRMKYAKKMENFIDPKMDSLITTPVIPSNLASSKVSKITGNSSRLQEGNLKEEKNAKNSYQSTNRKKCDKKS